MKVRNFIKFLMDFDMDAEIVVSTDNTFYDYEEMDISWQGQYVKAHEGQWLCEGYDGKWTVTDEPPAL